LAAIEDDVCEIILLEFLCEIMEKSTRWAVWLVRSIWLV